MITVGVTTFNRCDIVGRALTSALAFVEIFGGKVVLVDDASSDGTDAALAAQYARHIASGRLTTLRHSINLGVTAAKNSAFENAADADWVLFLDSDDELIVDAAGAVAQTLEAHRDAPVVFFRCVDERNRFIGRRFPVEQSMTPVRFTAHTSYGEALVAINKRLAAQPPFDADLRGYEGLGCMRLIRQFGPAILSTVIARRYDRSRPDRLSRPFDLLMRAHLLARGHLRYVSVAGDAIHWRQKFALRAKALVYFALGGLCALIQLCRYRSRS